MRHTVVILSTLGMTLMACAAVLPVEDGTLIGVEFAQQRDCIDRFADSGPDAQNACRAAVRGTWDHYWAAHFADGGAQ